MARVPRYLFGRHHVDEAEAIESGAPAGGGGSGMVVKRSLAEQTFTARGADVSTVLLATEIPSDAIIPELTIPVTTDDFGIIEAFFVIEYAEHTGTLEIGVCVDGKTWIDMAESTYNYNDVARATGGFYTLFGTNNQAGAIEGVFTDAGGPPNPPLGIPNLGPLADPWTTLLVGAGDHEVGLYLRILNGSDEPVQIRNAVLAVRSG